MRRHFLLGSALFAALPLGGAQASNGKFESSLAFVPLDVISVPIVDAGNVQGNLYFKVVLEAKDDASAEKLSEALPLIRAQALMIGSEFSRLSASPFLAVDAQRLSRELNQSIGETDQGIARVLLVEVTARSS